MTWMFTLYINIRLYFVIRGCFSGGWLFLSLFHCFLKLRLSGVFVAYSTRRQWLIPYVDNQACFFTHFLSRWFTRAHSLSTPFLVVWLHNYRIIASLYLTQQGVLNHWNREITDWDGMICWSQRYYQILPPLWWEERQEGGRVSAGREAPARSTSPQPVLVSTQRWAQRPQPIFDAL